MGKMLPGSVNQSFEQINSSLTPFDNDGDNDYLYDRADVRAVCIILYSIVFIACFFGNLIVIVVVTLHWKMRSITNFCLANLAFADFCVSIFCVYQNMYIYFMSSWVFGAFLCKMYYFITELSHTASILILVVICIERYLAIVHPMQCKDWLTITRLRLTIIGVWGTSAIYSSPRLYFTNIGTMSIAGKEEVLCIPIRTLYDSQTFDLISLILLFALPLLVITILYTRIGLALWESSKNQMQQPTQFYPPAPSIPAGPDSCSSSENNCEGVNSSSLRHHSCTDILCCGCHPCRLKFSLMRKSNGSGLKSRNNGELDQTDNPGSHPNFKNTEARIASDEHIVVVKFENKRKGRKSRRSLPKGRGGGHRDTKCTILFNGSVNQELTTEISPETRDGNLYRLPVEGRNSSPSPSRLTSNANSTTTTTKLRRMTVIRGGKYGSRALASRRGIIKMLIIIVFAFAICNLPFHARKLWQYYGSGYFGGSNFSSIFTPVTFLIMYANSGINPILYAFMSKKFRLCFMDLLNCKLRRSLCVARNASVRSTHIIPLSTTPA